MDSHLRRIDGRRLRATAHGLLESGRADEARKQIRSLLRQKSQGLRGDRSTLLDILFEIEMYCDRYVDALAALRRRRSLGFRTRADRFNAVVLEARLLTKTGQVVAARTELAALLTDRKYRTCPGILQALAAYVAADSRCREEMNGVLREGCVVAIAQLGIDLEGTNEDHEVSETIRRIQALYTESSKIFQKLTAAVFSAATESEIAALVGQLRERVELERVGIIRSQLQALLRRLEGGRNSDKGSSLEAETDEA